VLGNFSTYQVVRICILVEINYSFLLILTFRWKHLNQSRLFLELCVTFGPEKILSDVGSQFNVNNYIPYVQCFRVIKNDNSCTELCNSCFQRHHSLDFYTA